MTSSLMTLTCFDDLLCMNFHNIYSASVMTLVSWLPVMVVFVRCHRRFVLLDLPPYFSTCHRLIFHDFFFCLVFTMSLRWEFLLDKFLKPGRCLQIRQPFTWANLFYTDSMEQPFQPCEECGITGQSYDCHWLLNSCTLPFPLASAELCCYTSHACSMIIVILSY